ncbi:MAG: AraC family transcriptional regulator [Bacteroidota bacterium]
MEDSAAELSTRSLLLQILALMISRNTPAAGKKPAWVYKINEILHDQFLDTLTLDYLSGIADIHPVHLSRDFPRYFNCSFGEYIRKLKVEKSLSLIPDKKTALTEIAYECGFSDQSHFTRCFKEINGITPSAYRKILLAN